MLIQCTVKRGGGVRVAIVSLDRFVYRFEPRPNLTGNNLDMVADVNSASHQEYLLSHPADFRIWERREEDEKSNDSGVSSVPAGGNDGIRGGDGGATAKRRRKQYPSSAPGMERDQDGTVDGGVNDY